MYKAKIASMAMLTCFVVTVAAWAQNGEWRIDSTYSTASLSLVSSSSGISWNVAIAKVAGVVTLINDPDRDAFNLDIYPAREGARLLKQTGGFRDNTYADLSSYALMSFRSATVTQNPDGQLAATGHLSVTYVHRPTEIVWSNAYTGPDYGEPVAETTTRQVTFVFAPEQRTTSSGMHNNGPQEISGLATIDLRDFAALRTAWVDSVWPVVVENEHCEMPRIVASMKDYRGAICTGTPVEVTAFGKLPPVGEDYPRQDGVTTPAANQATILVQLRLAGGH